jgi:MATE family, multidrug efflux pump
VALLLRARAGSCRRTPSRLPRMSSAAPRLRTLLGLAWPVIIARATQSVIGFCDALMTAPLGENALAATTTGAVNTFAVVVLPMGTAFIVQSFAAQLEGRGDRVAARRYAWYGMVLALAAGVVAALAIPWVGTALGWFDYEPEVRRLMTGYLQLRLSGVFAIVGVEVIGNWYGGLGNTRLHMMAGLIAMVANVALNWVLIYGHLGAPAMGVAGAALASALAGWIAFGFVALVFLRDTGVGLPRGLRARELWRMIRFGLPNGINWFLEFGAFILFVDVTLTHMGTIALASFNVVIQINSVAFMPAFGVVSAGAILVGQAIGRGEPDRVGAIVGLTARTAAGWMVGVGLLYLVIPGVLIGRFAPPTERGPELAALGGSLLMLSSAWQLFDGVSMTLSEALRAAGDTAWSMWARVVLAWAVFTPASLLIVFVAGGGALASMVCFIGYLVLLAGALLWRFRSGAWRRIDLTGHESVLLA